MFYRLLTSSGSVPAFTCPSCHLDTTINASMETINHCGKQERIPALEDFRYLPGRYPKTGAVKIIRFNTGQ